MASRSAGEVEFLMLVLGTGYSAEEPSTLERQNQVGLGWPREAKILLVFCRLPSDMQVDAAS